VAGLNGEYEPPKAGGASARRRQTGDAVHGSEHATQEIVEVALNLSIMQQQAGVARV